MCVEHTYGTYILSDTFLDTLLYTSCYIFMPRTMRRNENLIAYSVDAAFKGNIESRKQQSKPFLCVGNMETREFSLDWSQSATKYVLSRCGYCLKPRHSTNIWHLTCLFSVKKFVYLSIRCQPFK